MAQVFENRKLVVIADTDARQLYFRPENEDVRLAISWANDVKSHCKNLSGIVYKYDGIVMPDPENETFFYASLEAAKNGKVWVEEAHAFMAQEFKSSIEGGCVDEEDLDREFAEEGGWNTFVLENIYTDIFGHTPVTGDEGQAVVYDECVATLCKDNGYDVLPCVKEDPDFGVVDYWLILAHGGKDEYFANNKFGDADIVYQFVKALRSNWYKPEYAWECVFGDEYERRGRDNTPVEDFCWHMVENRFAEMRDEDVFCGRYIKGFYNRKDGTAYFSTMKDEKTVDYTLSHESWMSICVDIEENPYDYNIEVYTFCDDGRGYLFHRLEEMPFDKWDSDKWEFIHATGVEYLEINGDWVTEYEDECEDEDDDKVILFAE